MSGKVTRESVTLTCKEMLEDKEVEVVYVKAQFKNGCVIKHEMLQGEE